jgi:hypothetical protein
MDAESVDWVELLRVYDRFQADITVRFLEDHGVPVQTAGGANVALPMMGMTDVRILVPRTDLERAGQVLEAMRSDRADVHPFRDAPPEPYEAPVAKRKTPFATILALLALASVILAGAHALFSAFAPRRQTARPTPGAGADPGPQIALPQSH